MWLTPRFLCGIAITVGQRDEPGQGYGAGQEVVGYQRQCHQGQGRGRHRLLGVSIRRLPTSYVDGHR
jgi:hypothetical protein